MNPFKFTKSLVLMAALLFAFGCGSGGGSSSSSTTPDTTIPDTPVVTVDASLRAVTSGDLDLILTGIASSGKKSKKSRKAKTTLDSTNFTDTTCLVFVSLLSDPDYKDLVAIIKTDSAGKFEITTDDIFAYLKVHFADVGETAAFADLDPTDSANKDRILAAYQKLGVLRITAFYQDGDDIVSMEYLQDVSTADPTILEKADPRDRILFHWVEKIFADLGIVPTEEQFAELKIQIEALALEILKDFELPEGVTAAEFATAFKNENTLILTDAQKALIKAILASSESLTDADKQSIKDSAGATHQAVSDPLANEMNQDLTGLINSLGNEIQLKIEAALNDSTGSSVFKTLLSSDGTTLNVADDTFKASFDFDTKRKESLMRFFIALGFPVVIEADPTDKDPLIAMAMPMPASISEDLLPGSKYFGDRNIRAFKVSDLAAMVTTVNALFANQAAVDAIAITPFDQLSDTDFANLERLKIVHEFARMLKDGPPLVSFDLIGQIAATTTKVKLKTIASVITEYFVWRKDSVVLIDEGGVKIPVFTGGTVPPEGGDTPNATEILRKLSIKLSSTPLEAVKDLTGSDAFILQFLPQAIEEGFHKSHAANTEFKFPSSLEEARQLVLQSFHFKGVRNGIGRGLIAAFPPPSATDSLFGTLLSGETELNAKSAIFFINFLLESQFLIDSSLGFINSTTLIPNFSNIKFLDVKDSSNFSLAKLVTSLLKITEFTESAKFATAVETFRNLCEPTGKFASLYKLPEFDDSVPDDINKKSAVTVEMDIEFFDGRTVADITTLVTIQAISVTFGANGPEETGDAPIAGSITASDSNNNKWKVSFPAVPSDKEYFVFIKVEGYKNKLPEFYFYADGFGDPLNITDHEPFIIPPDEDFGAVPCVGLAANQHVPGTNTNDLEGLDFSNFEQGLPFILPISKDGTEGSLDLRFKYDGSKFSLETTFPGLNTGDSATKALIAPLHVDWTGTTPVVSLTSGANTERLTDPHSAAGLNFLTLISAITDADMSTTASLISKSSSDFDTYFKDGPPLYLLKDRKGLFWIISVEFIDVAFDPGFVDLCFAKVGSDGKLDLPDINLEQDVDLNGSNPCVFLGLFFGDHAYFPTNTDGSLDITQWEWSAPKEAPFGYISSVAASAQIRYAGESFQDKVGTGSAAELQALEEFFFSGDFTSIPSRLDYYGPSGGGLAVISYNSTSRTWPAISTATYGTSVSSLKRGDMVLLRQKSTGDPDIICFVDKDNGDASHANAAIGLIVANYNDANIQVGGVLVDADKDGYIAKFDPNDDDPNIIPDAPPGGEEFKDEDASSFAGHSPVTGIFAQDESNKLIFVDINEFIEEVYQLTLIIKVKSKAGVASTFPTTGEKIIIEITPPDFTDSTITNFDPTASIKSGSSIKIDDVGMDHLNIDFITTNTQFAAGGIFEPGAKITFEYDFKFRPRDSTGNIITDVSKFGDNPARPPLTGMSELQIPELSEQVGTFNKATNLIQQGGDTPSAMADGLRLEPQKDIYITWDEVTNADFYEIEIEVPDIETATGFLPGFHERFGTDNFDRKIVIPAFRLPPGRSNISIIMIARRNSVFGEPTNDGAFISYSSISTTGEADVGDPGGFANNEIKLATGDKLYFHADTYILDSNSAGGVELFSVVITGTTVSVTLATGISGEGHLDGFDGGAPKKSLKKQLSTTLADGSTFNAKLHSFFRLLGITLPDGASQPVDVEIGGFRDGEVKLFAYLPPPFRDISSGGDFDVNGDATNDVNFNGTNLLTFNSGIKVSRFDPNLGPVNLSTDGQATLYTIQAGTLFVDFDLEFSDGKRYWFFIDLQFNALEFGEIIGGPADPTGGGDIFGGDLVSGQSLDFDSANFFFQISPSSSANSVFDFLGTTATFVNNWKIKVDDGNGPVEASSIVLVADQPKVVELFNDTLNHHFDLDLYLFPSGELGARILQPGGGAQPPQEGPYDPFTDPNTIFAFQGTMPNGNFFEANPGDPTFTFGVTAAQGANAVFNFINSEITPVGSWDITDEFGNIVPSIFPTAAFAQFIKFEDPATGMTLDGFAIMEGTGLKIGIFGIFGGSAGEPPPPTEGGLFSDIMFENEYLNIQGTSPAWDQFIISQTLSSTTNDISLFKFVTSTNEVSPENGWTIEIMTQAGPAPAPSPLIATAIILALKLSHPTDTREIFVDISLEGLDLKVNVIDVMVGGAGGPPPPTEGGTPSTNVFETDLIANEFFNYLMGDPVTFSVTSAIVSLATEESVFNWDGVKVTPQNGWVMYDPNQNVIANLTPSTLSSVIHLTNVSSTVEFDIDVFIDTGLLAVDVIDVLPAGAPPPPPPTDIFNGTANANEHLNVTFGSPDTFALSATMQPGPATESMFMFNASQLTAVNGWEFKDDQDNPLTSPFTATVTTTTIIVHKAGNDEYEIDVTLNGAQLDIAVIDVLPGLPPPPPPTDLFNGTANANEHLNVTFGSPDTFALSATMQPGPATESMFMFNASQLTAVNGWEFKDDLDNPLTSPITATVTTTKIIVHKPGNDEYEIDITLSGAQLDIAVIDVLPGLPPAPPIFDGFMDEATINFNIDFNTIPETAIAAAAFEDGITTINVETAFEFDKTNGDITLKNGWVINNGGGDLTSFVVPDLDNPHMFILENSTSTISLKLDISISSIDSNLDVKLFE